MPDTHQYDVRYLDDLALPYDRVTRELSDAAPRLVDGQNTYITLGGKLARRPGITSVGITSTWRVDRMVIYETLDNPSHIFVFGSLFNPSGGVWVLCHIEFGVHTAWQQTTTVRNANKSTRPHEMLVCQGKLFVKSFPSATDDKDGTIIIDGSGGNITVYPWGVPSPTVPARITDPTTWNASANPVTVNFGWQYVYAWKSATGQYGCRSDLERDPAQRPSTTGPFTNKKPRVTVQGHANVGFYPKIGIFRTTDGGGSFYFVEDITNTGAGPIVYEDNHRVPTTTNDPKQDVQLDTSQVAPSLISNLPPPPVDASKTWGVDPVDPSTNMAYYARRIWYGIRRLYFSGQEEILLGNPEECFPGANGIRGNYYLFQTPPRLLCATKSALYVVTANELIAIVGEDRTNFRPVVIDTVGAVANQPHAICSHGEVVYFLSNDLQVYAAAGSKTAIISQPLGTELRDAVTPTSDVEFTVYSRDGVQWLLITVFDHATNTAKTFVFDIGREMWFTPWTAPVSASVFGRYRSDDMRPYLLCATWDGAQSTLGILDPDATTDNGASYTVSITTNLFRVPAGNQLNTLNKPAYTPVLMYVMMERTKFVGDSNPTVSIRLDEFSGPATALTPSNPPYITQRSSYNVHWYPVQKVCQRIQLLVSKTGADRFEIQTLGFIFQPGLGA
jgi:hypothetical protein